MDSSAADQVRSSVREHYGKVAETNGAVGCAPGCCGAVPTASAALGYSSDELASVPGGANLGLGCGNPQAIAALRPGETVLDLGSGGGFDCFLAARQVGPTGRVIGVDMTPQMVTKARANARGAGIVNVDFRLGEIEHLPVLDASVDVVLSNCGINLSPSKEEVIRDEVADYLLPLIRRLPSPYREALTLTELDGLTQQAAADALGISLSGAKSRVQRGREKLRALLGECCRIGVDARGRVIDCEPLLPTGCRCKNE